MMTKVWIPVLLSLVFMGCKSDVDSSSNGDESATQIETGTQEKKRTARPVAGPLAPVNLGEFSYTLGDVSKKVTSFKSGYNDLTITKENVTFRLTDMNGASFLIVLQGGDIENGWTESYEAILSGVNQGPRGLITFLSGEESYQWKSGIFSVKELDPKTGAFKAVMKSGKAVNARDVTSDELIEFEFEVDMRFENIVNLTNSPF